MGGKLVYKILIVNVESMHFLSNLTILTFSKVTDRHLLGGLWIELQWEFAQVRVKAQSSGGKGGWEETMTRFLAYFM